MKFDHFKAKERQESDVFTAYVETEQEEKKQKFISHGKNIFHVYINRNSDYFSFFYFYNLILKINNE